tara:strand:- start:1495 stop:1782 length:288 start_codon:yes stop_codon:yes gene_type:complete
MEEYTADEISKIYLIAGDSVTVINADANFAAYQTRNSFDKTTTETEWKEMIERNVKHLQTIRSYKKRLDSTTSIWTTESFVDIDAAIEKGKTLYS